METTDNRVVLLQGNLIDTSKIILISKVRHDPTDWDGIGYNFYIRFIAAKSVLYIVDRYDRVKVEKMRENLLAVWQPNSHGYKDITVY